MAHGLGIYAANARATLQDLAQLCQESGTQDRRANFSMTPRQYCYPRYGDFGMAVAITGNVLRLEYAITLESDGAVRMWPVEFSLACHGTVRAQELSSATEERAQLKTLHEKITAFAKQRGATEIDATPLRGSRWILPVSSS